MRKSYAELEKKFYEDFLYPLICSACGEECQVVAVDDSFDYSGTHCTGGKGGTHHVPIYYVSDCCEADIEV